MSKSVNAASKCPTCKVKSLSIFADEKLNSPCELFGNRTNLTFRKGEKLIQAGDEFRGFFCINSGTVKIYKPIGEKKEFILWFAKPGESIGIDSFFNNENYQYSASATGNVQACFIHAPEIVELMKNGSSAYLHLMDYFCKRIDFIEKRITSIAQKKTKSHLAELLVALCPNSNSRNCEVNLEYSMKDLANIIGTTQNYLYKISSELMKENIITFKKKRLLILDQNKLVSLAKGSK